MIDFWRDIMVPILVFLSVLGAVFVLVWLAVLLASR